MILENLKEVLIAAQFDRARLMVIKTLFEMTCPALLILICTQMYSKKKINK